MIHASIVVATYNRKEPLAQLLTTLAKQTVPRDQYEVVVVDDGSREDATPVAKAFSPGLQVSVIRQENSGVAIARQRGVEHARGRIIIFLDDDMRVSKSFVAEHIAAHDGHDDRVVMGELLPDDKVYEMPLFERFHAHQNDNAAERHASAGTFAGYDVYTGNLSLPRELFLRVGGFDPTFFIEDTELGVRLELAGAQFVFSRRAAAVHASDHTSLASWLARSVTEGRDWVRLARKHPTAHAATPWSFFAKANPLSRPFFAVAVLAPSATPTLARIVFRGAQGADAIGWTRGMVSAMTLLYGIQYYCGVREETGSLRGAIEAYREFRRRDSRRARSLAEVRELLPDDSSSSRRSRAEARA